MKNRAYLRALELLDEQLVPVAIGALLVLCGGRWFAGAITLGASTRGALDFAMWWSWFAGGAVAAWLGSRCLAIPLQSRSARFLLVGPLSPVRWGLERIGLTAAASMGFFGLLALFTQISTEIPLGVWCYTTGLEMLFLTFVGGLFGTLFPPLPALLLTLAIGWIGHLSGPWAAMMAANGNDWAPHLLRFLPDLDVLDHHAATLNGDPSSQAHLIRATGWWMAWAAATLGTTAAVLSRRDL